MSKELNSVKMKHNVNCNLDMYLVKAVLIVVADLVS